ncbi:MAG TPA: matrixin family metalloprotease [Bryobacteraceae bacterium]|nr:matrixin family metalloprotease [Bryobacteraceae bacterium]
MQPRRTFLWLGVCLLALSGSSLAQPAIHLKRRSLLAPNNLQDYRVGPLLRRKSGSSHYLIRFSAAPSKTQLQRLKAGGANVVNYVPDASYLVSAPDETSWDGVGLDYVGRLDTLDKLSPLLARSGAEAAVVVEFHSDVDMQEARALVAERNLTIVEREGLLPSDLLVQGPLDQVTRLADWDEVAYIFPASRELIHGDAVIACAGALTEEGPVAQYVAMSPGWLRTGAAGTAVGLQYFFGAMTPTLPEASVKSEIIRAFDEWARNGNIRFSAASGPTAARTVNVFFASREHGDPYSFDGPGGVLAHTFYPAPPNPEPLAGDMHLDAEEAWRIGASIDVYSVVLHELGHSLGLGHSDLPSAVMYPFYKQSSALTADDIEGLQALYGAPQDAAPSVPLSAPPSSTSTPPDAPPSTPALSITIASPAGNVSITNAAVSASGSASGASGALRVVWTNNRGGSGTATGSTLWSVTSIPLAAGSNRITFTVTDAGGATASQSILVTRNVESAPTDRIAPVLEITSPGAAAILVTADRINLRGTASDNTAVVAVRWTSSAGGSGVATGTQSWQALSVPLLVGINKITVSAYDAAGNAGSRMITVTRR